METIPAKHVLLVDDDPTTRRLFGALLARAGFEVLYGKDGNEGREMAKRLRPDLILMDFNMPVMDGLEAAERIKADPDPLTSAIPIILLTSEDLSIESQKAAKEMGIMEYIQKGVSNEDFIELVKKALEDARRPPVAK